MNITFKKQFLYIVVLLITFFIGTFTTAFADAPEATNLSAAESYTEDTSLNLIDIVTSDIDEDSLTVTLALSDSGMGSLSTATSGAVTSTYNAGTGVWTAIGDIADVNILLADLTFTPAANRNVSFTIATSVSDGVEAAVTGTKSFTGTAVNDAPVLDNTKSPALSSVDENAGAPSGAVGTLVSNLVDGVPPFGGLDNVTEFDIGAVRGIAITAVSTTNLTWYYSLDSGSSWISVGAVSGASSLLLAANGSNRVYAEPSASFSGTVSSALTFRAWDQTSGVDGVTADTDTSGGTTAFSTATDTANLTVNAANNAPEATNLSAPESYGENFSLDLTDIVVSDEDGDSVTVTLTLSDTIYGTLNTATSGAVTSTFDTGVWTAAGAIADVNILLADLTFTPLENVADSFTIETSVSDGIASAITGTKVITGTPWDNHAPELDATKSPTLETIQENSGAPSGAVGTLVSSLVDFASPTGQMDNVTDFDDGAALGIAVIDVDLELSCYSSLDDGALWVQMGIDPDTSLVLFADTDNRVYCDPGSDQFGTYSEALTFRAHDRTQDTDGGIGDNIVAGGSTAVSLETDTISLTVDDVPESSSGGGGSSTSKEREQARKAWQEYKGTASAETILGSGTCPASLAISAFLKVGSRGEQVRILQAHINRILAAQFNEAAGPVDGIFGPLTKLGVVRFQTVLRDVLHLDLGPAGADGIVGPFTGGAANNSCGGM